MSRYHEQIPAAIRQFGQAVGVNEIPVAIEVGKWRPLTEGEETRLQEIVDWDVSTAPPGRLRVTTVVIWAEGRAVAGEVVAEGPPDEYKTYYVLTAHRKIKFVSGWLPVPVEGAGVEYGLHRDDSRRREAS